MPATLVLRHTESSRSRIRGERGLASGKSSEPVVTSGRGPVLVRLLSLPLLLDGFGRLLSIKGAGVLALAALLGSPTRKVTFSGPIAGTLTWREDYSHEKLDPRDPCDPSTAC